MSCIVPRTCTETPKDDTGQEGPPRSRWLADYRDTPAYVLLGDPGSGKTTAFEVERDALGENACLVTARDFLAFEPGKHPEWRGRTLFIDGLDEVRAGGGDTRTPLDALRGRLDALGTPRFRLSCREADWLGANDRTRLAAVSRNAGLVLLRLDPLTDDDIARILSARAGVADPASFVGTAKERGVDSFLANPQSLNMLADVVADGEGWPASRLELFDEACRRMLQDQNEEHILAAERSSFPAVAPEDLLDVAGRLCAVLLISGIAGYALERRSEDDSHPALGRCGPEYAAAGRRVVATKLFAAAGGRRFRPAHRHVAEFLGARHLARLLEGEARTGERRPGIPLRRVLATMTGYDSFIVTALRGLSAWLAVHSDRARADLVDRDPIGVGLYGDVSRFLPDEKRTLLASLQRHASQIGPIPSTARAFKTLATPALEPTFKDILAASNHGQDGQSVARFVLSVVAQGAPLPCLSETLLAVVRNPAWDPVVNAAALIAFVRNAAEGEERRTRLRRLLEEVRQGRIRDPNHELRGNILMELYPRDITPSDVWDDFSGSALGQGPGTYYLFWRRALGGSSTDSQVAEHLDALAARAESMLPVFHSPMLTELTGLVANLLARGLEAYGDRLETRRLYDWLGVGLLWPGDSWTSDGASRVRAWLQRHPAVQKAILAEGVNRCGESGEDPIAVCASEAWRRLYGSTLPSDFGLWCLDQAAAARDERIAKFLLARSFGAVAERSNDDGMSLAILIERARAHPILAAAFAELSVCPLDATYAQRQARRARREQREEERRLRHARWVDRVRSNEEALRANRVSPHLLHQIAAAYLGALADAEGHDPPARLANLFQNDGRLVGLALRALRSAIQREDLPDVEEVVRLRDRSQEHYLALPVLAGLSESHRAAPGELRLLDDARLRIALAFRYCGTAHDDPAWYRQAVASHPRSVAEVLMQTARPEIRHGRPYVVGLYELAYNESHADVARTACLPLLQAFPVRAVGEQMKDLQYLLWSALRHADRDVLLDLVRRKLSCSSMSVAQRGRWLAAAVIVAPGTYLDSLEGFADGREERMQHVMPFFDYQSSEWFPGDELEAGALRLIVRLAGCKFEPVAASGAVTPQVSAAEAVQWMISRLAASASEDASTALEALAADPALFRWREALLSARNRQRVVRRDTKFRHPTVEEVCRTLDDGPPANAADLAALTADRLGEIGCRIRNDNSNGWRLFWNEDEHRRADTPKHEESCRDALLEALRHSLPDEIDVQPEGRYANDKRADLRIAWRDCQIPVEIKKNGHPRLWSALHEQLIAQYARDPATDGYGIYLVLWFGEVQGRGTPPPATGKRPAGPDALRQRIQQQLTPDEARKISVCVMDVSAPPMRAG